MIPVSKLPLSGMLVDLQKLNEDYIGWNAYETDDGPQPNMSGHITYTKDAFWKKSIPTTAVKSLLEMLQTRPNDFTVSHREYDAKKEKFVIHELSDPTLMEKVIVLKMHREQLNEDAIQLLDEFRNSEANRARLDFYKEAEEQIAEWVFGSGIQYEDGKVTMRQFGSKVLPSTEQIPVHPVYD